MLAGRLFSEARPFSMFLPVRLRARRHRDSADRARDVGDWPVAEIEYRKSLKLLPLQPPIWIQLGHARKALGDLGGSEAAYRKALEMAPCDSDGALQLGHVLKIQDRLSEALEWYTKSLVFDPRNSSAAQELIALGKDPTSIGKCVVGRFVIDTPKRRLATINDKVPSYRELYSLVVRRICSTRNHGVVVDVGASVGDTAALAASVVSNPILAIEGREELLPYLRSNALLIGPQVSVLGRVVVSDASLPVRSVSFDSVDPLGRESSNGFTDLVTLIASYRSQTGQVALVKSSLPEWDGHVVAAMVEDASCPLFFECDTTSIVKVLPNPWPGVFRQLEVLGYAVVVFDHMGLPMFTVESETSLRLSDFAGYIHMQHCVGRPWLRGLIVWAFPPGAKDAFDFVRQTLDQEDCCEIPNLGLVVQDWNW